MSKQRVVRFGVIGTGGMGQGHCANFRKIREARLTAICDIDPNTSEQIGRKFKVPHFDSHRALLKSGLCDTVLIATPHPSHAPIAIDAFKAGLHVLCEKPLSDSISAADRMVRAAKRHRRAFGVMFQRRTEPVLSRALEIARSGKIGKVYRAALISPEYRSQAYYNSGGWRATWAGEGGGVLMNQAPHILDMFLQLAGRPVRVHGRAEPRLHDIEVEDAAEATLTFTGGGTGYVYCTTNETGPGQMIEVFGDKGKLIFRDGQLRAFTYKTPIARFTRVNKAMWAAPEMEELKITFPKRPAGHHVITRNFARHILHREKLIAPGEDGLASLELANAILLSSTTQAPVKLPLARKAYDAFLTEKRRSSKIKKNTPARRETDPHHK